VIPYDTAYTIVSVPSVNITFPAVTSKSHIAVGPGGYFCYGFVSRVVNSVVGCGMISNASYSIAQLRTTFGIPASNVRVAIGESSKYACFIVSLNQGSRSRSALFTCVNLRTQELFGPVEVPLSYTTTVQSAYAQSLDIIVSDALGSFCFAHSVSTQTSAECRFISSFTSTAYSAPLLNTDSPVVLTSTSPWNDLIIFTAANTSGVRLLPLSPIQPVPSLQWTSVSGQSLDSTVPVHLHGIMSHNYAYFCATASSTVRSRIRYCIGTSSGETHFSSSSDSASAVFGETYFTPNDNVTCTAFSSDTRAPEVSCSSLISGSTFRQYFYGQNGSQCSIKISPDGGKVYALYGDVSSALMRANLYNNTTTTSEYSQYFFSKFESGFVMYNDSYAVLPHCSSLNYIFPGRNCSVCFSIAGRL